MSDLPKSRIEPAPPFTYCGVDFFGPWHVQRGRAVVKRYGALFSQQSSPHRGGRFFGNRFVHKCAETFHLVGGGRLGKSVATEKQISLALKQNSRKLSKKWMTRRSKQSSLKKTSIGLRIQHVLATLAVSGKDKSGQSEAP